DDPRPSRQPNSQTRARPPAGPGDRGNSSQRLCSHHEAPHCTQERPAASPIAPAHDNLSDPYRLNQSAGLVLLVYCFGRPAATHPNALHLRIRDQPSPRCRGSPTPAPHSVCSSTGPMLVWRSLTDEDALASWWSTKVDSPPTAVGARTVWTFAGDFNPVM